MRERTAIEALVRATLSKSSPQQIEATSRLLTTLARALEPVPVRPAKASR